jgi:hypothetical protein
MTQSGLDTETHSDIEKLKCAMVNVKVLCKGSKYYSKKSDKDIAMIERFVNKEIEKKDDIAELFIDKLALVDGKPVRCKCVTICDFCDLYEKCNEHKAQEELRKWLKQPYRKPTYKLSQFEYDLLQNYKGILRFKNMNTLNWMKEKGYFKGIDENETVGDILANCEVIK